MPRELVNSIAIHLETQQSVVGTPWWNLDITERQKPHAGSRAQCALDFNITYIVCLSIMHAFPLILFFLHCFLTFLLPYFSFSLRTDPLHFQATKPGFSFLCCGTFLSTGECIHYIFGTVQYLTAT